MQDGVAGAETALLIDGFEVVNTADHQSDRAVAFLGSFNSALKIFHKGIAAGQACQCVVTGQSGDPVFCFPMFFLGISDGYEQIVGGVNPEAKLVGPVSFRDRNQAIVRVCRVHLFDRLHNAQQRAGQQQMEHHEQYDAKNECQGDA